MTGGTAGHDIVANALRAELRQRIAGKPCRLQGPELKVRAGENGRYPDALIDCGPPDLGAAVAVSGVLVKALNIGVASASNWVIGSRPRMFSIVRYMVTTV